MRFLFPCVSSVVRSAALGNRKVFNFVLERKGRAKNPALLISPSPVRGGIFVESGPPKSLKLRQERHIP